MVNRTAYFSIPPRLENPLQRGCEYFRGGSPVASNSRAVLIVFGVLRIRSPDPAPDDVAIGLTQNFLTTRDRSGRIQKMRWRPLEYSPELVVDFSKGHLVYYRGEHIMFCHKHCHFEVSSRKLDAVGSDTGDQHAPNIWSKLVCFDKVAASVPRRGKPHTASTFAACPPGLPGVPRS